MQKFQLLAYWQMTAIIVIEAKTIEEALDIAYANPLPENGEYLRDSFEATEYPFEKKLQ